MASRPMIATTIINSTSVNPPCFILRMLSPSVLLHRASAAPALMPGRDAGLIAA